VTGEFRLGAMGTRRGLDGNADPRDPVFRLMGEARPADCTLGRRREVPRKVWGEHAGAGTRAMSICVDIPFRFMRPGDGSHARRSQ